MKLNLFELCITRPLGFIISLVYDLVSNYGLAIILFTVIIKLILMPLQVKSQKAMKRQQKVQPIIAELQKKYANDQQRLQQEMMKVYKENNISMTGGCLPLLIQLPVLFGLYNVIQRPLTYIKGINFYDNAVIEKVQLIVTQMQEKFPDIIGNLAKTPAAQLTSRYQIQLADWAESLGMAGELGWDINFNFLGLDLSKLPSTSIGAFNTAISTGDFSNLSTILLILIPLVAMLTTWLSSKYMQSMTTQQNTNSEDNPAQSMTKSMNLMMPLMTLFFTFTLPSGMGIYWIISSVMQMAQQFILTKYFDRKEDDFVVKLPEKNRKNSKKRR